MTECDICPIRIECDKNPILVTVKGREKKVLLCPLLVSMGHGRRIVGWKRRLKVARLRLCRASVKR